MEERNPDTYLPACSQCGQRMGPESELLETRSGEFICECCYAQMLYPNAKADLMELIDGK